MTRTPKRKVSTASRRRRIRARMLRSVGILEQRTLLLGVILTVIGGAITIVAALSVNGVPFQKHYEFSVEIPGSTPPLRSGAQVRIAGKIAGVVTKVEPGPKTLHVDANLDTDFAPLGRGASVHVAVLLGTSLTYLVMDLGDQKHPLPAGTTIPASRVTMSSSLPQALETFDTATRNALGHNFIVLGQGYSGRGAEINDAIADQRVYFEQGTPLIQAFVPSKGVVARSIRNGATVAGALRGERADDVAAGTSSASAIASTLADKRATGADITEKLAGVEQQVITVGPKVDRGLAATTSAVRAFAPAAQQLLDQLPDFRRLFESGDRLVSGTRRFNTAAQPGLRGVGPLLKLLRQPAKAINPLLDVLASMGDLTEAYGSELNTIGKGLSAVTGAQFAGQTVLRVSGGLLCTGGRNPYPKPGEVSKDRKAC